MNRFTYILSKAKREIRFYLGLVSGSGKYGKVVIVTRSRSGSNLLCSFLESHPEAFVWREVFRRPHYLTPALTHRLISGKYLKRYRAVAFKVFYYHRVPPGFWEHLIADESIHIIHLVRENHLETYVSRLQAVESDHWESFARNGGDSAGEHAINVIIPDLMTFLEDTEKQIESFKRSLYGRSNVLHLTFEQIAGPEGRDKVRGFLAELLSPTGYGTTRNLRQSGLNIKSRIRNYEEVRRAILDSKWRHLLDRPNDR